MGASAPSIHSTLARRNWVPTPARGNQINNLKQGIKLLIINFPHNPTGAMLTFEQLNHIISLCDKYGCWLLSDEVFRGFFWFPRAGVGTQYGRICPVYSLDAGASELGSHAGAWEPDKSNATPRFLPLACLTDKKV
jgi:hypothetical protein